MKSPLWRPEPKEEIKMGRPAGTTALNGYDSGGGPVPGKPQNNPHGKPALRPKVPQRAATLYWDEDGVLFEDEALTRPAGYRVVVL
jgi:hypothetical protein